MSGIRALWSRLRALLERRRLDAELDEELLFHLDMETAENERRGLSPAEARRAARLSLGGLEKTREACRDERRLPVVETTWQDVRTASRFLSRNPGFSVVAALTLALGIGANAAIFTVLDAVILRPPPYPQSERLMRLWETADYPGSGHTYGAVSVPNLQDWRARNNVFTALGAYVPAGFSLDGGEGPLRLAGARVEADVFEVLGVEPELGRTLLADEGRPGADRVVVLGYGAWQRQFGGREDVVGSTIQVDGRACTVVGVMPEGFRFPPRSPAEVWAPLTFGATYDQRDARGTFWLRVVGRLRPGTSRSAAQQNMDAVSRQMAEIYPQQRHRGVRLQPLHAAAVADALPVMVVLSGAVLFVLLIACANVANMLLARTSGRRREIAIRLSLGAGPRRIVRLLLTEAALLACAGGLLGLVLSRLLLEAAAALPGQPLPPEVSLTVDLRSLAFSLAATLFAALVAGLVPALRASRANLQTDLNDTGPLASRFGSCRLWIVCEVALALILLVGAGLMINSLREAFEMDLGFVPEGVVTARVELPPGRYAEPSAIRAFFDPLVERLETLPGVRAAGVINALPVQRWGTGGAFSIEGRPAGAPDQLMFVEHRAVSPGYFKALGIGLYRGRYLRDNDRGRRAVLINKRAAELFWEEGDDPVGQRIALGTVIPDDRWSTVVGIVQDVPSAGPQNPVRPEMYEPYWQFPHREMTLVAAGGGDPGTVARALRSAVLEVDAAQPIFAVKTMREVVEDSVASTRFIAQLLAAFSLLALVLAAVGVYGVTSYVVAQRRHEFGLRMALGARRTTVVRMVLADGLRAAATGICMGLGLALGLSGALRRFVIGILPHDPATYGLAVGLALVTAIFAGWLPAHRAAAVDPAVALRDE